MDRRTGLIKMFGDEEAKSMETVLTKNEQSTKDSKGFVESNFYITTPWSLKAYFTGRGSENFHIYLWIAKDLSWTQGLYWPSMIFGSLALAWCTVLAYHAIKNRCIEEVYMLIALVLWLTGNFVWMAGEVFNNDDAIVVPKTAIIMETAIAWILFYHVILKPFNLIQPDEFMTRRYESWGLRPRFSYFKNWRQYEHAHTLCWLGKDLSWNQVCQWSWVLCLVPTVLIAADFIYITWRTKTMAIDTAHYTAQLIWVFGNMAWAMAEVFSVPGYGDDFYAISMWQYDDVAIHRTRWYSSYILLFAYFPIFLLYIVWLPLTFMGRIKETDGHHDPDLMEVQISKGDVQTRTSSVNNPIAKHEEA